MYMKYSALMDFVANHRDILTHAHKANALTHDGHFATDLVPDEEMDLPMSVVTFRDNPGNKVVNDKDNRVAFIGTESESSVVHVLYVHSEIREIFENDVETTE